ncbi:MAG: tRNA epoxyqueuosine(34) reductase QueG [Pseudomonadota bacterium]
MTGLRDALNAEARALGFSDIGVCRPDAMRNATIPALAAFVEEGRHGDMGWMTDRPARPFAPSALWPEARSVIMLAENYGTDDDPLMQLERRDTGAISVYARNRDYHDVLKKRLKRLGRWLVDRTGAEIKVFVDTAPVMEKPLAEAAGLGWRGKHTNLVSRSVGSWFFLGAIFTTEDIAPDQRHVDRCGDCRRCLDICPTDAFPAPYQLDARRCISYLTIEHKGPIPRELRGAMGNRIYGCDDCLAVCPWNKFAETAAEASYWARIELSRPKLAHLADLDDAGFREVFSGSPIKRIGRDRFVRNVLIAIGNSEDASLVPTARRLLDDPSPLVRGAAIWALSQLMPRGDLETLKRGDDDPDVIAEWTAALQPPSMS